MGIRYPGSNMQELNLDWVLSTVKENTEKVDTQLHDLTELEEKVDSAVYSVDHMTVEATTLQPEEDATATKSIINGHINIDFGIPKGEKGDPGQDGRDGQDGAPGTPATDAQVQAAVNAWLTDNIDPDSGYALDRTLSLTTAAAPADMVGYIRSRLANNFVTTASYYIGDLIWYNDTLYQFEKNHAPGAWDATEVSSGSTSRLSTIISKIMNSICPQFDSTQAYSKGDYVIYLNRLYQFVNDQAANTAWTSANVQTVNLVGELSDLKSAINNVKSNIYYSDYNWTSGGINTSGDIVPATQNNYYSKLIFAEAINGKHILMPPAGRLMRIVYYNDDVFDHAGAYTSTPETIIPTNNTYNIRFVVATTTPGTTMSLDDVLIGFTFPQLLTLRTTSDHTDFLSNTVCAFTPVKICHFSVDDVYKIIKDLIDNQSTYTSIYDNSVLSELQTLHNTYGLCITLNTFNQSIYDNSYSIANVPAKTEYINDFTAAKNWLKFGFHGLDENSNYSTGTSLYSDYSVFVASIYKLTGTYDCIDSFTRLSSFAGSAYNVISIANIEHGIKGLLCGDLNQDSYYLNAAQNAMVHNKGMYLDTENELIFLKTITRNYPGNMQTEINGNLCFQKFVELFSHENNYEWIDDTLKPMCTWLQNNGYVFAFPSLILT